MFRACNPKVAASSLVTHGSSQSSRKKRELLVGRLCRRCLIVGASINPRPSFPNYLLVRLGSGVSSRSPLVDAY